MSRLSERVENFNKAFDIYSDAVSEFKEEKILTHMALVQSFEIVFELAWKCLKDYLYVQGIDVDYPKEVIKQAFNKKTLPDGQLWMNMLDARNSTSHEYNLEKVNRYLSQMCTIYFEELKRFKIWIGENHG